MPRVLIIAYGNPLRSDDGVAWRAADSLAEKFSAPDVEILRVHQLTPELADSCRGLDRVIFIDAASVESPQVKPGMIRVQEITADAPDPSRFSHAFSPQRVLALAAELYDARPQAFTITVQGAKFDHGDKLSPSVANALPDLVSTVTRLMRDAASKA